MFPDHLATLKIKQHFNLMIWFTNITFSAILYNHSSRLRPNNHTIPNQYEHYNIYMQPLKEEFQIHLTSYS